MRKMICILIIILLIKCRAYKPRKLDLSNEIIIKINGTGTQQILNSAYIYKQDQILLDRNKVNINEENKILIWEKEGNIIVMKWDNKLTSC